MHHIIGAAKYEVDTMINPTELSEWQALTRHQQGIANLRMRDWFAEDAARFSRFSLQTNGIFLDYSRHRATDETLSLLIKLAHATGLEEKIKALFAGFPLNLTEKRPALHSALRDQEHRAIVVNQQNIAPLIIENQQKMAALVKAVHEQSWRGVTGKPIAHIVNIGIGGSHLGPLMAVHALKDFAVSSLTFHFISTVDKANLNEVLSQIDLEATLFILSSKSFSTIETLTNAKTIATLLQEKWGEAALQRHFVAITSAVKKAIAFGVSPENIFPLWDWVGGRYSIWSAIGLPLMLMIGSAHFADFLDGGFQMDQHFKEAPFGQNMPVLLALLSIWYTNFFHATTQAIIPYSHQLRYLIPYLQQAEMESNGKSVNLKGDTIIHATSPVLFGEEGCNGQHTYHQLLHQGKHFIPADFILIGPSTQTADDAHHDILFASALSQAEALMRGKTFEEAYNQLLAARYSPAEALELAHHQVIPGNRPSNILFLDSLTPSNLGALLALYEHKIFIQGAIWNINSFDQWGVELGKQLLPSILSRLQETKMQGNKLATNGFIDRYKKYQGHQ